VPGIAADPNPAPSKVLRDVGAKVGGGPPKDLREIVDVWDLVMRQDAVGVNRLDEPEHLAARLQSLGRRQYQDQCGPPRAVLHELVVFPADAGGKVPDQRGTWALEQVLEIRAIPF